MKNNKEDIKDSTIDIKCVPNFDANVINSEEANKNIRDIKSTFLQKVRKRVSNTNKNIGNTTSTFQEKIRNEVDNTNKNTKNTIFNSLQKVEKRINDDD